MKRMKRTVQLLLSLSILLNTLAFAQDKPDSTTQSKPAAPSEEEQADALQKAVQNPVASLISVPLQNNANFSYGSFNRTQDVLEIEPVIQVKLSDNWNLIRNGSLQKWRTIRNSGESQCCLNSGHSVTIEIKHLGSGLSTDWYGLAFGRTKGSRLPCFSNCFSSHYSRR